MSAQHLDLPDLAATRRLAAALAGAVEAGDVLLLDGPLGSGKTTLVGFLVEALGGDPALVASPTYTLLNCYAARLPVYHVDAYRLDGPAGLAGLGFAELAEDALGVIEWGSRVADAFAPDGCWSVQLEHRPPSARAATISLPKRMAGKSLQLGGER